MQFEWIPGEGIDLEAVERMKQHFPQPTEPTYEAWFISGTINYHYGMFEPVEQLSSKWLAAYLVDTGGGITSFGRRDVWVEWFQYLLPRFLPRFQEENLLELMMNYVFNLYPDNLIEEYPGFREDVMRTLPQAIMSPELWDQGDLAKPPRFYDEWDGYDTKAIYCSLFFCLKYLELDEIGVWVASIARIDGELWRGVMLTWLKKLRRFFDYIEHPEEIPNLRMDDYWQRHFEENKDHLTWYFGATEIGWSDLFLVFNDAYSKNQLWDFLPSANVAAFWEAVKQQPTLQAALD